MVPKPSQPAKLRYVFEQIEISRRRRRLQQTVRTRHFSIIACNCWGGDVYRDLEIPYQTPFVGLYLHLSCFIGFLENFKIAIQAPLEFVEESRHNGKVSFPVGLIMGAYEIHFMHYRSREEATEKWNRRRGRMAQDLDDCFFMLMHLERNQMEYLKRFSRLPFRNKVLFTDHPVVDVPEAIVVPPENGEPGPDDGPTLYRRCHRYFDLARWLNKDSIRPSS
jgi:uncharacterized protein (DUF1919 family)